MSEFDLIKQFISEQDNCFTFFIPADYVFLSNIGNTPEYLREYFAWKGKKGL